MGDEVGECGTVRVEDELVDDLEGLEDCHPVVVSHTVPQCQVDVPRRIAPVLGPFL